MPLGTNFWKNDHGFIWLLGFTILAVMMTQFSDGTTSRIEFLLVRVSLFFFTVVAIASSLLSIHHKRIGYGIAVAILLFTFILTKFENPVLVFIHSTLLTAYTMLIILLLINQILGAGKMTIQKIGGGVATYILIGHLWSSLYLTVNMLDHSAIVYNGQPIPSDQALRHLSYFSFVTLTTIGYGDILAISPAARTLVILEGLIGQLFPAIFIAKLVSHQIEDSRKRD